METRNAKYINDTFIRITVYQAESYEELVDVIIELEKRLKHDEFIENSHADEVWDLNNEIENLECEIENLKNKIKSKSKRK